MRRIAAALWGAAGVLLTVLGGCSDASGGGTPPLVNAKSAAHVPGTTGYVGSIVLRDSSGNPITKSSATPYNVKATCGTAICHGTQWTQITEAYHFSQGRTRGDGTILVSDNYSAKPWVMSDGMYGKW